MTGRGYYASVAALLIGLAGLFSVLLISPRLGASRPQNSAAARTMVGCLAYTTTLIGALPKAHAFVVRSAGSLSRTPSATARKSFAVVEGPPRRCWSVFTSTTIISATKRTTDTEPATVRYLREVVTRSTTPSALFVSGDSETTAMSAATTPAMESGGGVRRVLVPVADGSEEIESVTIIDTLVRAGASVTVASVGEETQVTCSRGVKIVADCKLAECEAVDWDAIVCPGGMPGATHLKDSAPLEALLRKQNADGRVVAAICAAPAVVLAAHGLLDGHKATCYPAAGFTAKLPQHVDEKVVVDGNIITSQGPATAMAFSLQLVESLFGKAKAEEVGGAMLAP